MRDEGEDEVRDEGGGAWGVRGGGGWCGERDSGCMLLFNLHAHSYLFCEIESVQGEQECECGRGGGWQMRYCVMPRAHKTLI